MSSRSSLGQHGNQSDEHFDQGSEIGTLAFTTLQHTHLSSCLTIYLGLFLGFPYTYIKILAWIYKINLALLCKRSLSARIKRATGALATLSKHQGNGQTIPRSVLQPSLTSAPPHPNKGCLDSPLASPIQPGSAMALETWSWQQW